MSTPHTKSLIATTRTVRVVDFLNYRDYLQKLYEVQKSEDATYSYWQLAQDLGFAKSNVLWLVINGRRKLTVLTSTRIADNLKLSGADRRYFQMLVRYNNARLNHERDSLLQQLLAIKSETVTDQQDVRVLEYFSEWYHPVIRELIGLGSISATPESIAEQLYPRLLPKEIERSIELLESLGLIVRQGNRLVRSKEDVVVTKGVGRHIAIRYHQKMMDAAKTALEVAPKDLREYNSLTVNLTPKVMNQAKEIIQEACRKVLALEGQARGNAAGEGDVDNLVFQLNFQLFPFTKPPKPKGP